MDNENIDDTITMEVDQEPQETHPMADGSPPLTASLPPEAQPKLAIRGRLGWIWWLLFAFIALIGITALSAFLGYQQGIRDRTDYEAVQVAYQLDEQFELGLQNLADEDYYLAQQHFEYIIKVKPGYPGVTDKLAEAMIAQMMTATPTPVPPTPTVIPFTPTPDTRGEEELFTQAKNYITNEEWSSAIETLEILRKRNPDFNAVNVDGMFYLALRNRGVQKIGLGSLEGGIYDLTLAERFGPLDTDANSWRTWARYYTTGASFWQVDWGQATYYFGQVAQMTPNLHDGTNWTAMQRYLEALVEYGDLLTELKDWCNAEQQFRIAYELSSDPSLEDLIELSAEKCSPPEEQDSPPPEVSPTPEGEGTATPSPTPQIEDTPEPSSTPETSPTPEDTPDSYPGPVITPYP